MKTVKSHFITKRGKTIARLAPIARRPKSLLGALRGRIRIKGDIVSTIDADWEASGRHARLRRPRPDLAR